MGTSPTSEARKVIDLSRVGFPRVLFALLRQRFTGTLRLQQPAPDAGERTVWFRGGMPLYTDWISSNDVLGELLVARGLVSSADCDGALQRAGRGEGPMGTLLVAAGRLDSATLSKALRLQCSRKLLRAFALRDGKAVVEAATLDLADDLKNPVNVLQLIRTGVQQHYDEARIRAEMAEAADAPVVATDAFQRYRDNFGFRDEDALLLREFAKGTQLSSLRLPGASRERAMQLAYTLWSCQMLIVGAQAVSAVAQIRESVAGPPAANLTTSKGRPKTLVGLQAVPDSTTSGTAPVEATDTNPAELSDVHEKIQLEAAAPRKPASPAERSFVRRLEGYETKIKDEVNAFALLGVPLDADRRTVRAAWNDVSKDFHPDRLASAGMTHLLQRVEFVFAALSEANAILSNREKREDLSQRIQAGGTGKDGEDGTALMRRALEAEMLARDGERLLRAGNFPKALDTFRESLSLSDSDPNVKVYEAWCRYQIAGREEQAQQKALLVMQTIVEDAPGCATAHYYMGLLFVHGGDATKARVAFNNALTHNPRLTDAARQLRAIDMRKRSASAEAKKPESPSPRSKSKSEKSGGLRGLFGKK